MTMAVEDDGTCGSFAAGAAPDKHRLAHVLNAPGPSGGGGGAYSSASEMDLLLRAVSVAAYAAPAGACSRAGARTGRVACALCARDFGDAAALRKHRRVVHLGLKRFACGVCRRRFAEKSNLKKHIVARHDRARDHACTQCEKTFSFSDGLRRHVNNCHLGLRPYGCAECGARFKQRTHLQKHCAAIHALPPAPVADGPKRRWLS